MLSRTLRRFNTLREFECNGQYKLADNDMEMILQALSGHSCLTSIHLKYNMIGRRALAALTSLLHKPNPSLTILQIRQNALDDEGAGILAAALAGNSTLRKLDLSQNDHITIAGWRALFTRLHGPQSSLEDLQLYDNCVDDAAVSSLANCLSNGSNLKVLNLSQSHDITAEGWRSVFDALGSPNCLLEEMHLHTNGIYDEEVTHLVNCLANNSLLRHLSLCYNRGVTQFGWRTSLAILQNPNSALEVLDLSSNLIGDDVLVSFANSLRDNNKLRELLIDDDETEDTFRLDQSR